MPLFSSKAANIKVDLTTTVSIKYWTSDNLKQFLTESGYDKKTVVDPIYKQQFDGNAMLVIKAEDLLEIGVPRGAGLSLLSKIKDVVEQQIQIGLISQQDQPGLLGSPRRSPRISTGGGSGHHSEISSSNTTTNSSVSPRRESFDPSTSSSTISTTTTTTTTTTLRTSPRGNSSTNGHHHHNALPSIANAHQHHQDGDLTDHLKKSPALPRKSEATLLLQAKVVSSTQSHQDSSETSSDPHLDNSHQ